MIGRLHKISYTLLIGGIAAKEAIISTLGTAYALGKQDPDDDVSLAELLRKDPSWNQGSALALLVFVMLYAPTACAKGTPGSMVMSSAAPGVDHAVMMGMRILQLSSRPVRPLPMDTAHIHDVVSSSERPASLAA